MSNWYVYMVRCTDNSLYIGITNNIELRIARHNAGEGARYTRSRRPVQLVWKEDQENESMARKREVQLKRLTKMKKEDLIKYETPRTDS